MYIHGYYLKDIPPNLDLSFDIHLPCSSVYITNAPRVEKLGFTMNHDEIQVHLNVMML